MTAREALKREFDGVDGTFLFQARCRLAWDWDAFRRLTAAMREVASEARGQATIETWIAEGFWFCDTWIRDYTSQPNFPKPPEEAHREAIDLIHDLSWLLFTGDNPFDAPSRTNPNA